MLSCLVFLLHRHSLLHQFDYSYTYFSSFHFHLFPGDGDITIWEMGRWSSGFGQSHDHVVSSHMHVAVTQAILSAASTFAIGDASGISTKARGKWSGRKCSVIYFQVHWVPGHCVFKPNEKADDKAKKVAEGDSGNAKLLPPLLCRYLPLSSSAPCQENMTKLAK
jgi:hypothetical protein